MQVKNHLVFGLVAILLIGGTVLPGMAQTETDEEKSGIIINLDKPAYDLGEDITITGQVQDFEYNSINPGLNMVEITFLDSSGNSPSSTYTDDGTLCDKQNCAIAGNTEQLFNFKLMPDGLGNFELSTNLNRGLFNPDIWNVHVSTHVKSDAGTQKITEDSEFEIVSTEEEQVSIEQEKIVFQTCEKIMPMNKELASTECSSSNDFAVGDTLIVKGQVVLEDRSPGAIPKMVTVAIPYPKAMILIENGNFITSTAAPQLLTQKHTLTNNIVKIIPGSDGSFITSFDLRNGVYQSGLYAVTSEYLGYKAENSVRVIDKNMIGQGEAELIVNTDKTEYSPGETVQISGQIMNTLVTDQITLYIESPDISAYNCAVIDCLVDNNEKKVIPEQGLSQHDFVVTYQLSSNEAAIGKYTIRAASSVTPDTQTSFFVTEESSIIAVTPSVEEESTELKKLIKKFNRISESEISIALDDMEADSELKPRVIQGSLFTTARGQEADVNIQVSASNGSCIIGQDNSCMINESTRKPGAIYETVTIGEEKYKIRYTGTDVRLEKFSILPEASGTEIDIKDWNVQIIKDEQPTRFYYKVSYVNLE